ncbi:MAG TPA: SET domain-containing protein-lysine N-methyltransferase [Herpetosiphonaceae bacterium]|nr:SET domain-containing protein-lysine N-methyltransferase [Herpetosiphonaceae bacterium]
MLMVRTKIGPSQIHGIGIFADEFIPKGTLIWQFQQGFDIKLSPEALRKLSPPALEQVLKYGYFEDGEYILCSDDARFFNASRTPNCTSGEQKIYTIAARDISKGEELTEDYREFDVGPFRTHHYP